MVGGKDGEYLTLTAIEQKIIASAKAGLEADFRGEPGTPTVSGTFLTKLLSGDNGDLVHRRGLQVAGLRIDGPVELDDLRKRSDGSDVPGFAATYCTFTSYVDFIAARLDWLRFDHCAFAGGECYGNMFALRIEAATINFGVYIRYCTFDASIAANSACILHNVSITRTSVRVQGGLFAVSMLNARVQGSMELGWLRLNGGPLGIYGMTVTGDFSLTHSVVRDPGATYGVIMTQIKVGGGLSLFKVITDNGVGLLSAQIEQDIHLANLRIDRMAKDATAIDLQDCRATSIVLQNARVGGSISATRCLLRGDWIIENVWIDTLSPRGDAQLWYEAKQSELRRTFALTLMDGSVKGGVTAEKCVFDGRVTFERTDIDDNVRLRDVQISHEEEFASLTLAYTKIGGMLHLRDCAFASGMNALLASIGTEVHVTGCQFGSWQLNAQQDCALWLGSANVGRDMFFGASRNSSSGKVNATRIDGIARLDRVSIGRNLVLSATRITGRSAYSDKIDYSSVILDGSTVVGNVLCFDGVDDADLGNAIPATQLHGSFSACSASFGMLSLSKTTFRASGEIVHPYAGSAKQSAGTRKGFAISLAGSRIGALSVGTAKIEGLVDLRNATVKALNDGGGTDWGQRGKGHLLIDGLKYEELERTVALHDQADPKGAVAERLAWIKLSYLNGVADEKTFRPQPYEQLASFFVAMGDERSRRRTVVAKREIQRQHGGLSTADRMLSGFLKLTSDYGYSPARALAATILLMAVGSAAFVAADRSGALVTAEPSKTILEPVPLAIDLAIPLVDFTHADNARVDASHLPAPLNRQWLTDILMGVYELVGLVLVSVTVLTMTGVLREKE